MDRPPKDPAARRQWLEQWAAEHAEPQPPGEELPRLPLRARLAVARRRLVHRTERLANRILDRGIDTEDHATEPEHEDPDRAPYQPSPWQVLPSALRYLGVSEHDTFVDFGCGKGRVVHQAARRPFRRVIGVEVSPALAEIARASLAARAHQHRCPDVQIVVADVTEFAVPDDLTIGYLFDPVKNQTFDAMLGNIIESIDRHPRRVRLIYLHPTYASRVLDTKRFRLLKEQSNRFVNVRRFRTAIFESL